MNKRRESGDIVLFMGRRGKVIGEYFPHISPSCGDEECVVWDAVRAISPKGKPLGFWPNVPECMMEDAE